MVNESKPDIILDMCNIPNCIDNSGLHNWIMGDKENKSKMASKICLKNYPKISTFL